MALDYSLKAGLLIKEVLLFSMYEIIRQTRALMFCILTPAHNFQRRNDHDQQKVFRSHFPQMAGRYYISREDLIALGWKSSKPPVKYAPGKMLFGGIYYNAEGKLPSAPGRVWFEADINYYSGKRNQHRVLFSNDGLIFVTYDHCITFYEIV